MGGGCEGDSCWEGEDSVSQAGGGGDRGCGETAWCAAAWVRDVAIEGSGLGLLPTKGDDEESGSVSASGWEKKSGCCVLEKERGCGIGFQKERGRGGRPL
jgi:hypothetical protein